MSYTTDNSERNLVSSETKKRIPVTIICVFNNISVRRQCLDRSIELHHKDTPEVEYLPIDNVQNTFPSAGSALNHGASQAKHDYLVFVHQDVFLHSLIALEEAAGLLASNNDFGMLGAIGVSSEGKLVGRIRDRIILTGSPVTMPTSVDSIDEVLFVIPRKLILNQPLISIPEFSWHAYAVEYGLRLKSQGLKVGVADIPLTHNSLTINLDRLDVAHAKIGALYPHLLPLYTSCGEITESIKKTSSFYRIFPTQRWRFRWLRESFCVYKARKIIGGGLFVLSDIRQDIDQVLEEIVNPPLLVINCDRHPKFIEGTKKPLILKRLEHEIAFNSMTINEIVMVIDEIQPNHSILLTDLTLDNLITLTKNLSWKDWIFGYDLAIGYWIYLGTGLKHIPVQWLKPKSIPLAMTDLSK